MTCIEEFLGPDGNPSQLYPELVTLYGQAAALTKFREVSELYNRGELDGYPTYPNGEPKISVVKSLVDRKILGQPTAVMVKAERVSEIEAHIERVIPLLQARLKKYEKGEPGFAVKEKSVKDLKQVLSRIEQQETLQAYVDLVKYADMQLREYDEFLRHRFDARGAAANENLHSAALAEIAGQLETFRGVVAPDLARDNTSLQDLLVGTDGTMGLQQQKVEVEKLVEQRTLELVTALVDTHANREGLSEEDLVASIKQSGDVLAITRAMGGAANSSDKLIATAYTLAAKSRLAAEAADKRDRDIILEAGRKLVAATGSNDYGFMLKLDAAGKATGKYVQKIGQGYYNTRKQLREAVTEAGEYITSPTSQADRDHNIAVWQAKQNQRGFTQAEYIDKKGVVSDGASHRYTDAFKQQREKFEVLRQDGKKWVWGRRPGLLGYATLEEANEQYDRYVAKYYNPESLYWSMVTTKDGTPTGELVQKPGRFTNSRATTEVIEENYRDPQYQALLNDKSAAGQGRLAFYHFFMDHLEKYGSLLGEEDASYLEKGNLPAVMAKVATGYNTGPKGFLDWAGRVVSSPLATLKEFMPAIKAAKDGVRTKEDGSLDVDVAKKYTGGFRDEQKIARLQKKLTDLEAENAKAPFKEYEVQRKRLQTSLTIEQNRGVGSEVETNLPMLLLCFGAMSRHYSALKTQEGNFRLLQHAVNNREYYYQNSDGSPKLGKDGRPVLRTDYSSQASKQLEDWLAQNVYQDMRLEEGEIAKYASLFQGYSSMAVQGLNVAAALKNATVGFLSNRIVGAAGKFGLDKPALTKALNIIGKDTYVISADRLADVLDRNSYVMRPKSSIVDAMMSEYNILQHGSGVDEVKTGKLTDYLYIGTTIGEYGIQSNIAVAKMLKTELTGLDGKKSSFWDAHSLVNGTLRVDPNYAGEVAKLRDRLTLDIRNINKHVSGNYAEDDKVGLSRNFIGRLVLQYHKWAYNGFKAHFGRRQFDEGVGEETKGYYRSIKALWDALEGFSLKLKNFDSLSELDKKNLKVVAKEMQYVTYLLGMLALTEYLKPEPDDEDAHYLYVATNFAQRVLGGTRQELTGYANPIDLYNNAKNPVAGLTFVADFAMFTKNLMEYPYYAATDPSKLDYQTGTRKGDSKLLKSAGDLLPVVRMKRVYDQLQTTGTSWIK